MTPDEEAAYEQGRKAAGLSLLRYALGEVYGKVPDDPLAQVGRLQLERTETVAALRHVCAEYGDNKWPDDLHLADVVEKCLERPLSDCLAAGRCPSCESRDLSETTETQEFTYGVGDKAVKLTAKIVLITCQACKEAWTDERGEHARSEAVTRYLQRRVADLEDVKTRLHVDLARLTENAAKECGRLRAENARLVEAAYAVFRADPGTIPAIAVLRAAVAGEP